MYLDYAGIRVKHLARSVRFYTRALGLHELRRGTMGDGGVWVLLHDPLSHQHLELNWYPSSSKHAVPYVVGEGLDHLGFRTPDVDRAVRRLSRAGATLVDRIRSRGVTEIAFLQDPDGLWVELIRTPTAAE